MKSIPVEEAAGLTLCQDITQIIRGVTKGPRFRKGHVIQKEDIPVLLSMGKEHIYVWSEQQGMTHEEDGARILYKLCASAYMEPTEVKEGKIEAKATKAGVLEVDCFRLKQVNSFGEMMIATKRKWQPVEAGEVLAGMRIIPLVIESEKLNELQAVIGSKPLLRVHPYTKKRVGIVTTGSEIYKGRIKDGFKAVLEEKLASFPIEIIGQTIVDDATEQIIAAIESLKNQGADIILCTGGMSVDADDLTPKAIQQCSEQLVCYGTPVLPGAMFALGYTADGSAIMGLPGSVMFAEKTVFDLIFPRIVANINVSAEDIAELGHGGLL